MRVPRIKSIAASAFVALAVTTSLAIPSSAFAVDNTESSSVSAAARVTDHWKEVKGVASVQWRDYGNGYVQVKKMTCYDWGSKTHTVEFILRADGGKTTFATWGADGGKFDECKTYRNGKHTIAKSRKPYVKIIDRDWNSGTHSYYIHLY